MLRIFFLIIALKGSLMATEEPKYTVIGKYDKFEIRKYAPYIVAQTEVSGSFDEMGRKAFRILFKYISGENEKRNKIRMTAPVIQENSDRTGQKIQMTAPVIQEVDNANHQRALFSFVMPEIFTLDTLPIPLDKRVKLKEISSKTVAVLQYTGSWSEKKYNKKVAVLLEALKCADIRIVGKPIFARYNSTFSLSFFRRNEIMIEIEK